MDWQIRVALIIFGIALVGYIYFDYSKKKKIKKENDKLKKQFSKISTSVDSSGFDFSGVGKARSKSQSKQQEAEKIEPEMGEIETKEFEPLIKVKDKIIDKDMKEKVYSLIIQAPDNSLYKGNDFMPLFLSQGLKYGEMNIFHRYENLGKDPGDAIFSLANAVEPGTFELEKIDSFSTPALAIFSSFAGSAEYLNHYKNLVKTAEFLVKELGGKILDKSGKIYTDEMHKERLQEINSTIL